MVGAEPIQSSPVLEPGSMVDHFQVVRLAGRGGMGEVYLARDTKLGRKVALKVVHADALGDERAVERFLHEARTTARFNHPHIVTVYAVGELCSKPGAESDGADDAKDARVPVRRRPYVALEWLEGQTLRERMAQGLPGPREAMRLGLAIAEALAEAHRN